MGVKVGQWEETGSNRDVVFKEDVEGAMDGEANEPRSVGMGKYIQEARDHNKAEATEIYWPCPPG